MSLRFQPNPIQSENIVGVGVGVQKVDYGSEGQQT